MEVVMLFWVLCLAKFGGRGYECVNGESDAW